MNDDYFVGQIGEPDTEVAKFEELFHELRLIKPPPRRHHLSCQLYQFVTILVSGKDCGWSCVSTSAGICT